MDATLTEKKNLFLGICCRKVPKKSGKFDRVENMGTMNSVLYRVATAQGKQGIWLLTFPDRENTGNLVNLIFYTGKMVPTQGKFMNFLKILLLKWQQGDGAFLS